MFTYFPLRENTAALLRKSVSPVCFYYLLWIDHLGNIKLGKCTASGPSYVTAIDSLLGPGSMIILHTWVFSNTKNVSWRSLYLILQWAYTWSMETFFVWSRSFSGKPTIPDSHAFWCEEESKNQLIFPASVSWEVKAL